MERNDETNENMKKESLMVKRGAWKPEEDLILKRYIETHGEGKWTTVSKRSGLMRGAKSCRMRWKNHLRPNIKRGQISEDEEDLIIRMHKLLGNRWSLIAGRLPGRTDNEIKNYWNTHITKRKIQHQSPSSNKMKKLSHKIHLLSTLVKSKDCEVPSSSTTQSEIIMNRSVQKGYASLDAKGTSCTRTRSDKPIINGTDEGCSDLCTVLPYNPSLENTFSSTEEYNPWWLSDETTLYEPCLPSLDYSFLSFESFGGNADERWNKYLNCL